MADFSNGTEGMMYEEQYCDKCVHQGDENSGCMVWLAHLCHAYDLCNSKTPGKEILDMLIPMNKDGLFADKCSMFYGKSKR